MASSQLPSRLEYSRGTDYYTRLIMPSRCGLRVHSPMSGVVSSFTFHVGLLAVVDGLWNSVLDPRTFLLHASGTTHVSMASPKAQSVHFPFRVCGGILSQFSEIAFTSASPRRSPDVEFPNTMSSAKLDCQYALQIITKICSHPKSSFLG